MSHAREDTARRGEAARSPYVGRTVSFGTIHGKQDQVSAEFWSVLGANVQAAVGIDTDQFGTFTGDVARVLTPMDAARAKARLGMEALGVSVGLASEASYGSLPGLLVPGHQEMLIFLDDELGIEVLEGENLVCSLPGQCSVTNVAELGPVLVRLDLTAQALIARPAEGFDATAITKGITSIQALERAIAAAARASTNGYAVVEPDLRAHYNAQRRQVISRLGGRLAARLATPCPSCNCPGYGRTQTLPGVPCRTCRTPTQQLAVDIHSCHLCPQTHEVSRGVTAADPMWCDYCNP